MLQNALWKREEVWCTETEVYFVYLFLDPHLSIANTLVTANGMDNIDWRCLEAREKALGMVREVFTEEVELKLNFEEWPGFLQAKEICSNIFQETAMGFENQLEHR